MTDVLLVAKQRRQRLLTEIDKLDEFILFGEGLVASNERGFSLEGSTAPRAIAAVAGQPPRTDPPADDSPDDPDDPDDPDGEELVLRPSDAASRTDAARSDGDAAARETAALETKDKDSEALVLDRRAQAAPNADSREIEMTPERIASALDASVGEIADILRAFAAAGRDERATSQLDSKDLDAMRTWLRRIFAGAERMANALSALPLDDRATSRLSRDDIAAIRSRLLDALDPVAETFDEVFGPALRQDETATTWLDGTNSAIRSRIGEVFGAPPAPLPADRPMVVAVGAETPAHEVDLHVGRQLRQLRWMMGLSQQQVGDKAGLGLEAIGAFETGAEPVTASGLWELGTALGVNVSFFFEGLAGQAEDGGDTRVDILTDTEALELVRAYYAIPESQRKRLFDLARVLKEAA